MNEMSVEQKQKILIKMYKEIQNICNKYNLDLYATGGTVLGAIRHKGFIPWDDDMDFAMPRNQLEKFVKIASKELPEYLKVRWMYRGQHYTIVDTRYEIELDDAWKGLLDEQEKAYVFIDLQPFDGVPNNFLLRYVYSCKVLIKRALFKMSDSKRLYHGERPKWEKICIIFLERMPFLFKDENRLCKSYVESMKKYNAEDKNFIADFCGHYHFKDIYPKKWWMPGIIVPFENVEIRIPIEYDKYLTQIYGDYMKIPDIGKRMTHEKKRDLVKKEENIL